jgi:hypothetical protein
MFACVGFRYDQPQSIEYVQRKDAKSIAAIVERLLEMENGADVISIRRVYLEPSTPAIERVLETPLGPISKAIVNWRGALENENVRPTEISLPAQAFQLLSKEMAFLNMFLGYDEDTNEDKRIVGEFMGMKVRLSPS